MTPTEMHIDALMEKIEKIEKLKAENARYREALEFYADMNSNNQDDSNYSWYQDTDLNIHLLEIRDNEDYKIGDLARKALKGER